MQKFKVTKQQIKDAGYMPAIPETCSEYLIFEGELLEGGGTVEKCIPSDIVLMSNPPSYKCKNCGQTWRNNEPTPICHNKKEGQSLVDELLSGKQTPTLMFNREKKDEIHCLDCDKDLAVDCTLHGKALFNRETPQVPQKINVTFPLNELGETLCLQELVIKYNYLLDYLKVHE